MEFEGIVIRRTNYKGDDVMIRVLTNNGIRSFLAKGVLKLSSKNAPSVNLFTRSLFQTYHGKDGDWLRVGEIKQSFPNINLDFDKLACLDFISEITNYLIDTNDSKSIYDYLNKTLEVLNDGFSPLTITLIYFAKVLIASGYGLNVDECFDCNNKTEIIGISPQNGGFVCKNCFSNNSDIKLESRQLKILRYIFKVDTENLTKIEFENEECKQIITHLIDVLNWHSQLELKSIKLLINI